MARPTMAALISRVRLLVNDPAGPGQIWTDEQIQDVMDESRVDVRNQALKPQPTFSGSTIQYLDYFSSLGGWEDSYVLKQFLITVVTPSLGEPIAGHWQFAATTLPPVYISGIIHDVYRAAADLLERQSARWALSYNVSVDGQNLQRSQAHAMLLDLAHTYRLKQRAGAINVTRSDVRSPSGAVTIGLGATPIDYMGSGNGR